MAELLNRDKSERACTGCGEVKPISEFGRFNRAARGGKAYVSPKCRPCRNALHDPLRARKSVLRTRYKLPWDDFLALLEKQGGGCGVCGASVPGGKGHWHIDHDHSCCHTDSSKGIVKTCGNCVRGVLCHLCNTALGCARDDIEVLTKMIAYLSGERHG